MRLQPYVFFDGRCEEALEFYRKALGAKVEFMMRYKESPAPPSAMPADSGEKILHASVRIGETVFLASDGHCLGKPEFKGFGLVLTAADEAEVDRLFAALADGGEVRMAVAKTFFSARFGMVADRFGVLWMVMAE